MIKLTKQVNKEIQSSWNKDDENEEHVIVPGDLSEQVVDTFAGLTPEESFEMLFNEEAKELIVSETNRYARTVGNNIMYALTENMLKRFVAILVFHWLSSPSKTTYVL